MAEFTAFRACEALVGLSIGFRRRVRLSVVVVLGEVEVFVCLLVDPLEILIHKQFEHKPKITLIINTKFFLFFKSFRELRIQIMNGGSHGIS